MATHSLEPTMGREYSGFSWLGTMLSVVAALGVSLPVGTYARSPRGQRAVTPTLEDRVGALADVVPQFVEGSWRTSAELMTEWRDNSTLRGGYHTANFALYRVEEGEAVFYFGGRENNPIFKNIAEASRQLRTTDNYIPSQGDISLAVRSALRVRMSDLQLQKYRDEFGGEAYSNEVYFTIDTKNYASTLNPTQKLVAEAAYGQGTDFEVAMLGFANATISRARVFLLSPEYVKQHVKGDSAIVRACYLYRYLSVLTSDGGSSKLYGSSVRGVPLHPAIKK